jgi:hypothetical protein
MLGKRVTVKYGPRKGYKGYVKAVGNTSLTVELDALFNSSVSPTQTFAWENISILYVCTALLDMWCFSFSLVRRRSRLPYSIPILDRVHLRPVPPADHPGPQHLNPKEVSQTDPSYHIV